jgi:hypothetical protein
VVYSASVVGFLLVFARRLNRVDVFSFPDCFFASRSSSGLIKECFGTHSDRIYSLHPRLAARAQSSPYQLSNVNRQQCQVQGHQHDSWKSVGVTKMFEDVASSRLRERQNDIPGDPVDFSKDTSRRRLDQSHECSLKRPQS